MIIPQFVRLSRCEFLGTSICSSAAKPPNWPRPCNSSARQKPDVAVIDIGLKTGNGRDLIKRIKARGETVRMLVWSMYQESLYAERVLQSGALGYITKDQATEKIVDAIRRVLEGKIYLSEAMTEKLLIRIQAGSTLGEGSRPEECLSDRELEIF